MVCDDDDTGEGLKIYIYTFGYKAFDYKFSTVRNVEEEKGSQIETKEVLHILGMAHPAAPGIGKVHSSNRPCRRRYFDRSPRRKKNAWSILGLGLSLVLTST